MDRGVAQRAYNDIKWFILMRDPFATNPNQMNRDLDQHQVTNGLTWF